MTLKFMDQEVGSVINSRDFLVYLDGLPTIRINDMVENDQGLRGWVTQLLEDSCEVLMVDAGMIMPNEVFRRLSKPLVIEVGDFLLGRAISSLGVPIDGKGPLKKGRNVKISQLDAVAPGVEGRRFITEQFLTGITIIDSLIPLGRGQRQLVVGDAHSGKTQFLIDVIVNQKKSNVICIYASIGKPAVSVRNLIDTLRANDALDYTIIVAASSSEPAPLIFLGPKTALTCAEYFQNLGRDVLLILDDMSIHAKIHREIALLSGRPPGKESYPGDTFYQQAHLLERAGSFDKSFGGGSITALPVLELNLSDFTTLIPTNLMAMTDGHLLFRSNLYNQNQRPAIDISFSVSRVGRQTQDRLINLLSAKVRSILSSAQDFETLSRFSSELPFETQLILQRRDLIMEIIKQEPLEAIPKEIQAVLLALPFTTFMQDKTRAYLAKYKKTLIDAFTKQPLSRIAKQVEKMKLDEELIKALEEVTPILAKICP